jgi:hypothetical protein
MSNPSDFQKQIRRQQADQMRHMAQNAELQRLRDQHHFEEMRISMERGKKDLLPGLDNRSPYPDLMKQQRRQEEDMLRHFRQQQEIDSLRSSFLAEDLRIQQQRKQADLLDRLSDKKW